MGGDSSNPRHSSPWKRYIRHDLCTLWDRSWSVIPPYCCKLSTVMLARFEEETNWTCQCIHRNIRYVVHTRGQPTLNTTITIR